MLFLAQAAGGINAAACQIATIVEGSWVAEAVRPAQSQMVDVDNVSCLDPGLEIVGGDAHAPRDANYCGLIDERMYREVKCCSVWPDLGQPQHLPLERDRCRAQMMGDVIRRQIDSHPHSICIAEHQRARRGEQQAAYACIAEGKAHTAPSQHSNGANGPEEVVGAPLGGED